jgi:hypothetical protein
MAPANVAVMQKELAFLPAWYAAPDDFVLVEDKSDPYYTWLTDNLLNLPKPIAQNELEQHGDAEIALWGISPQAIHYFEELNKNGALNLSIPAWEENYSYLNNRQAARDCLVELVNRIPQLSDAVIPHFYTRLEDITKAVADSPCQLLAKAPYSSSGRGLLWLPPTGLTRTENQILHGILKKQGSVSVEQVLDKQIDFAMEFMSDGQGSVKFVGYSLFYTNPKGGYEANYIGSQKSIEDMLAEKVQQSFINEVKENLIALLAEKYSRQYNGCIGVDMLIYKEGNEYRLQPCLEINMRYNMGFLSYHIYEKYARPCSHGKFYTDFNPKAGEMYKSHLQMQREFPPHIEDGRLLSGYIALCPVNEKSRYRAYILITKDS